MNGVVSTVAQKKLYLYKNESGNLISLTGCSGSEGRGTGDSSNAGSAGTVWRGGTGGTNTDYYWYGSETISKYCAGGRRWRRHSMLNGRIRSSRNHKNKCKWRSWWF